MTNPNPPCCPTPPAEEPADTFPEKIYALVNQIPPGSVATYGYLALLAGRPQAARQVGRLMAHAPAAVAAHRVVSHTGRPAPGCPKHRPLLEAEGVSFKPSGRVNLREHLWRF